MPGKTGARTQSGERIGLGRLFKRELMKWYFGAMYDGKVKTVNKNKTSFPVSQKKCKNI